MATIPVDRAFLHGSPYAGHKATEMFAVAASQTSVVPGDAAAFSSGLVTANNTATAVVGLWERSVGSTALATNTPVPLTIILPHLVFEASASVALAYADLGVAKTIADNAIGMVFTNTGGAVFKPHAFVSDQDIYRVHPYIDAAATAPTAGQTMNPLAGKKGITADTTPRLLGCFAVGACALVL